MQIVIEIPDRQYELLQRVAKTKRGAENLSEYGELILNGTPLPKGHGRLGDLDKIQSMARKKAEDCFPEGRYDYGYRKALFDFAKDIDNVPTIIEADKESEE